MERCLECHPELRARVDGLRGFHGLMDPARLQKCGTCHVEHAGRKAALVHWPKGRHRFDHRLTGFKLEGAHVKIRCDDCHKPELVRDADVRKGKSVNLARTHLGLPTRCSECHKEPHRGQFAARIERQDCAACHIPKAWKSEVFDHDTARFRLDGKHASVACAKCHHSENDSGARVRAGSPGAFVRFRPLEFGSCLACHKDEHRGQFARQLEKGSCTVCHTTRAWRIARFDHGTTRFQLDGKHVRVACSKCHYSVNASGARVRPGLRNAFVKYRPLRFGSCGECHKDPHRTRYGQDCARCHSTAAWGRIALGSFNHDQTDYPLRGMHTKVACRKCHRSGSFKKKLAFGRCSHCHEDVHGGQLAKRSDRGTCESCHTVQAFSPARFGRVEHSRTRFPLRDAHLAVACNACHKPTSPRAQRGSIQFRFRRTDCAACHRDPHAGQFTDKHGRTDCARCHVGSDWKGGGFDHNRASRFALEGAHGRTACGSCHRQDRVGRKRVVRYKPLNTACRSCHAEPVKPESLRR
ncbi:MAG: cytochrome c3 family protein [Candidatus Krumholzibacteriia bacterium]